MHWIKPRDSIGDADVNLGLRMLFYDGICSQVMGVFTGGAFLVAFALLLGASNTVIGLIAAAGPLSQILQIPAVFLVDKTRLRKVLVIVSSTLSRIFWIVLALLPWLVPGEQRVFVLLCCLFAYFALGTISGCAWNSWIRDLVPEKIMGTYFSKRLAAATAVGALLTVAAGVGIDLGKDAVADPLNVYSILFFLGAAAGLLGVYFLGRVPEPRMTAPPAKGIIALLSEPFRDANFRELLKFLASWNFAINLAAPFFVVYMLMRLDISMAWILALSVLSQITNVVMFPVWGRLADRFSNKTVLGVAGPLFIVSIAIWPFTTMPERYLLTFPLLVAIHVLAGMSTAGVNLCSANIALKISPKGKATAFLATSSLVNGLSATIAPILAGLSADWFAGQELSLSGKWTTLAAERSHVELPVFNLRGLDFLFVLAVLAGLYAMHRLIAVREEGEVEEFDAFKQIVLETRKSVRHISNVAGLRKMTDFPYSRVRDDRAARSGENQADSEGQTESDSS